MNDCYQNAYYYSLSKDKNEAEGKAEFNGFKWMDHRQTNDSTKEMGTADFTTIISAIQKEVNLKSLK